MKLWKDIKCNKYFSKPLGLFCWWQHLFYKKTYGKMTSSLNMMSELCHVINFIQFERSWRNYFWSYIILYFSTFFKELTVHLIGHANKWVITIHPLVTWCWYFVRICLNKFYAYTKSIKKTAFEKFRLFPESQPSKKIGSNNDKQIKLFETDGE